MNSDRAAYQLLGPESTGLGLGGRRLSPFVGREPELALLMDRLRQVGRAGRGHVVHLMGEPGAGKSRLLFEFRRLLADERVSALEGRCASYAVTSPYAAVADVRRRAWAIDSATDRTIAVERVHTKLLELGLDPEALSPYLFALLGIDHGPVPAHSPPEALRARIFDALTQVLQAHAGSGPLVLVLEDLHWIDPASESFVASFAERLPGLACLMVLTMRPGRHGVCLERPWGSQLALPRLTPEESRQIAHSILTREIDGSVVEQITRRAEGNPFFLEELAWSGGPMGRPDATVPPTIRDVLSARIDGLPPGPRRVLEIASVLGREADRRLLDALVGRHHALADDLDFLVAREFLREHWPLRRPVYAFKHALTQEVAYDRVAPAEKRRLHAAAERHIEHLHAKSLDSVLTELAHHAVCAENWERAHSYLRACSVQAIRASAFFEAAQLLQQALDTLRHLPATTQRDGQHFETSLELWSACWESGQFVRILELERQIGPLAHALGREPQLAAYIVRRAQLLWGQVRLQEVVATVAEALRLAAPADVRTRSYAHFLAGSACRDLGSFDEALRHLRAGARLFDGLTPDHRDAPLLLPILVNIYAWRSEIHAVLGHHHDACAVATRALALARSIVDGFRRATSEALALIDGLDSEDWGRFGLLRGRVTTVLDLGTWLANHNIAHLAQIDALRSAD